jgi:FAD/FMN-containing dehydrogenase
VLLQQKTKIAEESLLCLVKLVAFFSHVTEIQQHIIERNNILYEFNVEFEFYDKNINSICFFLAPLVGHVGDGNFHLLVLFDPNDAEEKARAKDLTERVARYDMFTTP